MFDKILKPALAAGIAIAAISAPASAQVNGMGYADIGLSVAGSQALQTGFQQISTTYQAQAQQAEQLIQQRSQLLQPLDTNGDGQLSDEEAAAADDNLVQQAQSIDQQIAQIQGPIQMARLYVVNQIGQQYRPAVEQVMADKSVSIMLAPEAIDFAADEMNLTGDVIAALNTRIPTVSITPPQGWQPTQATVQLLQQVQQIFAAFAAQQQAAGQAAPASGDEVRRN